MISFFESVRAEKLGQHRERRAIVRITKSVARPVPNPGDWETRLHAETRRNIKRLRRRAIRMLAIDFANWSPLLTICEQVMKARDIRY